MAKVLTTKQSAAALEDILRKAKNEIYLISFSFIISDTFITRIRQAVERGVLVKIVYGKSIRQDSLEQLIGLPNLNIYFRENMHAKIFANETKCVIGSMNFSQASENNNIELGVLLSQQNDEEAYEDAMTHCIDLIDEKATKLEYPKKSAAELTLKNAKLNDWDRYEYVLRYLKKNYGPVANDGIAFCNLVSYNIRVFMDEDRVDFIFDDNPKYPLKKGLLKKNLSAKINDPFWVNSKRVNITAKTQADLEVAIKEVMGFTLVHLV